MYLIYLCNLINLCLCTMSYCKTNMFVFLGAVMICFPMGLPPNDPVRVNLEGSDAVSGKGPNTCFEPSQVCMNDFMTPLCVNISFCS